MHMRRKKWARPELALCPYYVEQPDQYAGQWAAFFGDAGGTREAPLHVELGCGKGVSTARMAFEQQKVHFIAVDINRDMLAVTRRNIARAYGDAPIANIALAAKDIARIGEMLTAADAVERVYINFCNPWSEKRRHEKRRLTHPRQLVQYKRFLVPGGEIWFKTDDESLFSDSIGYFEACGFSIAYRTDDLHASGFSPNYVTEHEQKFADAGLKIKFLRAVNDG